MSRFLILIFSVLFFSCTQAQEAKEVSKAADTKQVQEKSTQVIQQKPPALRQGNTNNPYKSTSRPANEMVQEFPFDIDLKDASGDIIKSDDLFSKKKPTVLMFWLTTCAPCHRKMAAFESVYPEWKEKYDFDLYAISGDFAKNYESFVSQVEKKDWDWPAYNDMNREFRQVLPGNLNGYPQTFVFDKKGKLVYNNKRYRTGDFEELEAVLQKL